MLRSDLAGVAEWAAVRGESLAGMTATLAADYLAHRAEAVRQSQLDSDRQSLDKLLALNGHTGKLSHVRSELPEISRNKYYSASQVAAIMEHQRPANALATRIVAESGIRAHELHTLRPADGGAASHRAWRDDLFTGRGAGVTFLVTGKGGLVRQVQLSPDTAALLERHKLTEPVTVRDRGVFYEKHYDPAGLSGGARWSASFGRASVAALEWSEGGHALRHTYVEQRMATLTEQLGYDYNDAKLLISQELGHFRGEILAFYGFP